MKVDKITKQEKEYFDFLNELREMGVTNMFAAAPYLMDHFGMSLPDAQGVLLKWMNNFNRNGYKDLVEKEEEA